MFTGLIEEMGTVIALRTTSKGRTLSIKAPTMYPELKIGDSIATNGVCLTVTKLSNDVFSADIMPLTLKNTNLGKLKPLHTVNLERAMMLTDRLDGHMATGHIDAKGLISKIQRDDNAVLVEINLPHDVMSRLIDRGSIAIDGISLTIQKLNSHSVTVSIIPHTALVTTLFSAKVGDEVNVESDVIGKYVARFLERQQGQSKIDMNFLSRCGF